MMALVLANCGPTDELKKDRKDYIACYQFKAKWH
jgi:hypothetical protein